MLLRQLKEHGGDGTCDPTSRFLWKRDLLGFRRKSSENVDLELSLLHIHIYVYSTFHIE